MSIQRRLLILIIATIALASFFAAIHGYQSSRIKLDEVFDKELSSLANFILSTQEEKLTLPKVMPSDVVFQVYQKEVLLSQSQLAPVKPIALSENAFGENSFNGKRWRTYSVKKFDIEVMVAHPIAARYESAESILFVTITPLIYSLPIIALMVLYIIRKSLQPLSTLSFQLQNKSMEDLTEIEVIDTAEELTPVVSRLNHLLHRLDLSFEREKQLTANAAHELRTPVSVLSLSAHNLMQDFKRNNLHEADLINLKHNVDRMAHVTEQIIALYRFSPENFNLKKSRVDIVNVLQEVISQNYDALTDQQQNIVLESPLQSHSQYILGEKFALYTLFENLIKNANKYSGEGADIRITITSILNKELQVTVEDSGTGVDEKEMALIFERFYRTHKQKSRIKGSGLGLSIVKHIVELHHANIGCFRSELGGLAICITFDIEGVA